MVKIKGWEKIRDDNQYVIWKNSTTGWQLLVTKSSYRGWKCSVMAEELFDTKTQAIKCATNFMRGHPNG
jgi:hypothetical protein